MSATVEPTAKTTKQGAKVSQVSMTKERAKQATRRLRTSGSGEWEG